MQILQLILTQSPDLETLDGLGPPMSCCVNRIKELLTQVDDPHFFFKGPQKKLAEAVGISEYRLSRIIRGQVRPRYDEIIRLCEFFEEKLGQRIDPRDIYYR